MQGTVRVGFTCTDKAASDIVDAVVPGIRSALERGFPDFSFSVEKIETADVTGRSISVLRCLEFAHEALVRRGLDFAFTVTSAALETGRDSSMAQLASRSLASAVIPLPLVDSASTAPPVDIVEERPADGSTSVFENLFFQLLGILCGLDITIDTGSVMDRPDPIGERPASLFFTQKEKLLVEQKLEALTATRAGKTFANLGLVLFYLRVLVTRPLRIVRMALDNKPWKLVTKLHKLVFPAVVTVPLALIAVELWQLGVRMTANRMVTICLVIVFGITAFIVIKQKLLWRMHRESKSEQVALLNYSSVLSIIMAVALVMAVIFAFTLAISAGLFPRKIVGTWLGVTRVTAGDYLRVSFFIACIASIVGWLGAGFTESDEFRLMLYTGSRGR